MIKTLETYAKEVVSELEKLLGNGYWCKTKYVIKNNDVKLFGIVIRNEEDVISPVIYLDDYYNNNIDVDYAVGDILSILNKVNDKPAVELEDFCNFESYKGKIRMKLINAENNKEYLENVVNIKVLDLAIVFYIDCSNNVGESYMCSITVSRELLKLWNIDESHLLEIAQSNMQKYSEYVLKDIVTALADLVDYSQPEGCEVDMYVLTNSNNLFGASQAVSQGVLAEIANKFQSDLILLPSSVHEWIILPSNKNEISIEDLKTMVREINVTQVAECDVLSDNVYYYEKVLNRLSIAE